MDARASGKRRPCQGLLSHPSGASGASRASSERVRRERLRTLGTAGLLCAGLLATAMAAPVLPYQITGDGIAQPLGGLVGDPVRGRAIVADRRTGLCLLCHTGTFAEERSPGTLATDLSGAGRRWSEAQLRLRVVDARAVSPGSFMPAFHRVDGLQRVGASWQGRPLLSAQQVEDVVAFLLTLQ